MYKAKVKQKGQLTIPAPLRSKLGIRQGSIVELVEAEDSIIVKPLPPLQPGKPVGEKEYRRLLREVDQLREHWR